MPRWLQCMLSRSNKHIVLEVLILRYRLRSVRLKKSVLRYRKGGSHLQSRTTWRCPRARIEAINWVCSLEGFWIEHRNTHFCFTHPDLSLATTMPQLLALWAGARHTDGGDTSRKGRNIQGRKCSVSRVRRTTASISQPALARTVNAIANTSIFLKYFCENDKIEACAALSHASTSLCK